MAGLLVYTIHDKDGKIIIADEEFMLVQLNAYLTEDAARAAARDYLRKHPNKTLCISHMIPVGLLTGETSNAN